MQYQYPVEYQEQPDGSFLVRFPDVPEALTEGASLAAAEVRAKDCLIAALAGYIEQRRDIPKPGAVRNRATVILPPLIAAKLALYQSMRDHRITRVGLADKLGVSEGAIRRLLDLDHRSHIEQVEKALHALGQDMMLVIRSTNHPKVEDRMTA